MPGKEYSTYDDKALTILLRQGDADAFAGIYDRYWERLFAISYYHCRQKEMAREIVQDVFMSLWDRRASVEIQQLSAYLATATKFLVLRELRKEHRRRQSREANLAPDDLVTEQEGIEARFLHEFLLGQVEQLPEQCRIVYRYSREQHLSISQIANRMSISPKTAENHLSRALRALRLAMKGVGLLTWLLQFFF